MLVEEFVAGTELTASILGERALPLIRIEAPQGNYDYHNKYFSDETQVLLSVRACPTRVEARDPRRVARARSTSSAARGWGRLDLILRDDGSYSFLEVNTSPGMTGHSPRADGGASRPACRFADLCVAILRGAHVG